MKVSALRKDLRDYEEKKDGAGKEQLLDKLREGVFDLDTEGSPMKRKFEAYQEEPFQALSEKIKGNAARLSGQVESIAEGTPHVPSRKGSVECVLS